MVDQTHELEESLIKRIERCTAILEGLDNNASFNMLLDDFKKAAEDIDNVWHLETDLGRLNEMRITKFATNAIVMALENYKHDLNKASEQLAKIRLQEKLDD